MRGLANMLATLHSNLADDICWLGLADVLAESGYDHQAEVARLVTWLRRTPKDTGREAREQQLRSLLATGISPCVPVLVNSVGMSFAAIPPGVFLMGSEMDEPGALSREWPQHKVEMAWPFYLGVYPVTQAQYRAVTRARPSHFSPQKGLANRPDIADTTEFPVEGVSWNMAVRFCEKLSARAAERAAGRSYRLPTEVEWEYACRAGTCGPYHSGEDDVALGRAGWWRGNSGDRPHRVGCKEPNGFGLCDMHGNIWQWCADYFNRRAYQAPSRSHPQDTGLPLQRVLRGGSWAARPEYCRAAFRANYNPDHRDCTTGFRVVLVAPAADSPP
jgi:formylglycine-generating enzyme required for sulfatase activity